MGKQTFVIWAPDYPDAQGRRDAERAEHVKRVEQLAADGFTKIAGPLYDPGSSDKQNGSLVILEAESAEAVRAIVEKDVYWTKNVWDKEKLEIRAITVVVNAH